MKTLDEYETDHLKKDMEVCVRIVDLLNKLPTESAVEYEYISSAIVNVRKYGENVERILLDIEGR